MVWLIGVPFAVVLLICALIDSARRRAREGDEEGAGRQWTRLWVVVALVGMAWWTLKLMLTQP